MPNSLHHPPLEGHAGGGSAADTAASAHRGVTSVRWCREDESSSILAVGLIRHAYVLPSSQRSGVGSALLEHLQRLRYRRLLVGTWAAAQWAIGFYRRHGFELVPPDRAAALLDAYWNIPARQVETSVVLANPPLE